MPYTAAGAGAFLTGAGALASGLGLGGSKQKIDYRGAKRGIRWRVRDARAAGIHPLYAMGAPGIGSGQILSQQGSDPGEALQGAGAALSQYASAKQQKEQHDLNLQLTQKRMDYIDEQIEASKHARNAQSAHGSAVTSPAGERFKTPTVMEMYDPQTGQWVVRTGEESRMDFSETVAPYVDMWIHNPERRKEIEAHLADLWKKAPGIRRYYQFKDWMNDAINNQIQDLEEYKRKYVTGGRRWDEPRRFYRKGIVGPHRQ